MKTESQLRAEIVSKASTDDDFRRLLLSNPARAARECFGVDVPADIQLHVHEDSESERHIVLPSTGLMSEKELQEISAGVPAWYPSDPDEW